ncbi:hypothetical protein RFI_09312, partial [Reticulomyxa filosa]
ARQYKHQYVFFWLLLYVWTPLYFVGRILSLLFPVLNLIVNIVQLGHVEHINLLQLILTFIYFALVFIIVFVLGPQVFWFYFVTWHISPGNNAWISTYNLRSKENKVMQDIQLLYASVHQLLLAQKYLNQTFGDDIGGIIWSYVPVDIDTSLLKWYDTDPYGNDQFD